MVLLFVCFSFIISSGKIKYVHVYMKKWIYMNKWSIYLFFFIHYNRTWHDLSTILEAGNSGVRGQHSQALWRDLFLI